MSCCIVLKYVEMKKGVIAMKRKSSYNGKGDKERLPEGKKNHTSGFKNNFREEKKDKEQESQRISECVRENESVWNIQVTYSVLRRK